MKSQKGKNYVVETGFLKFSQPAVGETVVGQNTVAEPSFLDNKKRLSLKRFLLKFNFSSKNGKKKKTIR